MPGTFMMSRQDRGFRSPMHIYGIDRNSRIQESAWALDAIRHPEGWSDGWSIQGRPPWISKSR